MRKKEQRLWDRMRRHFSAVFWLERQENVVASGRPDVDVMIDGVIIPVELKYVSAIPCRAETPVLGARQGLNRNQKNWWLRWTACHGAGFILIDVAGQLFVVPGRFADEINLYPIARLVEFSTDWDRFALLLCSTARTIRGERTRS